MTVFCNKELLYLVQWLIRKSKYLIRKTNGIYTISKLIQE